MFFSSGASFTDVGSPPLYQMANLRGTRDSHMGHGIQAGEISLLGIRPASPIRGARVVPRDLFLSRGHAFEVREVLCRGS